MSNSHWWPFDSCHYGWRKLTRRNRASLRLYFHRYRIWHWSCFSLQNSCIFRAPWTPRAQRCVLQELQTGHQSPSTWIGHKLLLTDTGLRKCRPRSWKFQTLWAGSSYLGFLSRFQLNPWICTLWALLDGPNLRNQAARYTSWRHYLLCTEWPNQIRASWGSAQSLLGRLV